MTLLHANNLIRQARAAGAVLFVERGEVYAYPGNKLSSTLQTAITKNHANVRELLILAAL